MFKKIGFVAALGIITFMALRNLDISASEAAEKVTLAAETPASEKEIETVTLELSDLETFDHSGLSEDLIIGYKDADYYKRMSPEFSHNTVIITVDEEILDREKVEGLCEKYDLSILYDYANFSMYALTSETEFSDTELAKLIDDLSLEEGIVSVHRDYICHTTDDIDLDM